MANELHHAAARGLIDIITTLGRSTDGQTSINKKDQDGDTPLLKAVKNIQIEATVALVAFGADINISDKNKKTPIHVAFENRSIEIAKLLCSLGAHVNLSDWFMELRLIDTLEKPDREMLLMVVNQEDKMSAFLHKLIRSEVVYIESGKSLCIEELGVTLEHAQHQDIFLRCMLMIPEYADFHVPQDHCFFGDIFEFQCWNKIKTTAKVKLIIPGVPQPNERLSVLSLAGNVRESRSLTSIDNDKNCTNLTIDIDLKKGKLIRFAVLATEFPEVFDVSRNGTKITPEMEPESYINIEPDTFQTDVQMKVNFAATRMWNQDDESNKKDFLFTNVLHVTSSHDQKPDKDMEIMLPLHTVPAASTSAMILVSDKTQPEDEYDWKLHRAEMVDIQNMKVKFQIRAFKWCVAALSDAISAARRNAIQAIKGEKLVNIFAVLKKEHTFYEIVVEFSLRKKFHENKNKWVRKGYSFQSGKEKSLCKNKPYKISFSGNIEVIQNDTSVHLIFDMRKERNFRTFQVKGVEHNPIPTGQVYIGKPVIQTTDSSAPLQVPKSFMSRFLDIFRKKRSDEPVFTFIDYLYLEIGDQDTITHEPTDDDRSPQRPVKLVYKYVEVKEDPDDIQCSYPVLRRSSLKRIGELLTKDECIELSKILRVTETVHDMQDDINFGGLIFCTWRKQKRPNPGLTKILVQVLHRLNRMDLADIFTTASKRKTEFNYKYE